MWSDLIRIIISVLLFIAFLILFGEKNIKRYINGGIAKIRDEKEMKHKDIPIPGDIFVPIFKREK